VIVGTTRRAVFLDRDGTLVHAVPYPSRPEQLRLFDGVGPALRRLQARGFLLIVATNQSGVARGFFDRAILDGLHAHLRKMLEEEGVVLDAIYDCPHHPSVKIDSAANPCACRKPGPGMLVRAAEDFGIDLAESWMIGDMVSDVEAGRHAGCRTILLRGEGGSGSAPVFSPATLVCDDIVSALEAIAVGQESVRDAETTTIGGRR